MVSCRRLIYIPVIVLSVLFLVGSMASVAFAAEGSDSDLDNGSSSSGDEMTTQGWEEIGTCEWQVDESGCLIIQPQNGIEGTIEYSGPWPWQTDDTITSVVIKDGVKGGANLKELFSGLRSAKTIDLSGLDTSAVTDMTCMFLFLQELN